MNRNISRVLVLVSILGLLIAGCSSEGPDDSAIGDRPGTSELLLHEWVLRSLVHDGQEVPLILGAPISARFSEDNTVRGSAGCNDYFGIFELDGDDRLVFGSLEHTEMFCEGRMDLEDQFLDVMGKVSTVEVEQGSLRLSTADGQNVLLFERVGLDSGNEREVSWEEALEILYSGRATAVTQLHSLEVTLTLDDGSTVRTVEPHIDDIFQAIQDCGQPCSNMVLATE